MLCCVHVIKQIKNMVGCIFVVYQGKGNAAHHQSFFFRKFCIKLLCEMRNQLTMALCHMLEDSFSKFILWELRKT